MTQPTLPGEIVSAESVAEAAEMLGRHLGLDGPASREATERARSDALYARALHNLRNVPALRDRVLQDVAGFQQAHRPAPSLGGTAIKAANSILKWGMEGLKPSEPWIIEKRLAACNSCDMQIPAPDTLMYRGAEVVVGKDAKICASCNCLTNTKAVIPSERCPEKDPQNSDLSRWGEAWVPVDEHPKGPWQQSGADE